jgi:MscS family membrane protein
MRRFLKGTNAWHDGGREAVPETVDLSFLPSHVQSVQGPILVDYLNRILDRTNYLVSQEIPNDPQQPTPYVHYRHAAGDVVIEPVPGDGEIPERWLFSASTLESAPSLFAAIEALPVAEGVTPDPPLTPFFRLRETVRAYAPGLLSRALFLEAWQWLSLALWITVSTMASRVAYAATLALVGRVSLGPTPSVNRRRGKSLARPIGLGVMVVLLMVGISFLGLASGVFEALYQLLAVAAVVIAAWLTWRLADDFGGYLYHRTEQTPGYADEIAASMAIGTVKLVIAIVGLIVAADIADLPYEGVLAGLGVGGVALAFAARETVSNMLAGALLMADRPFKRGHLLETHGELAVVETVGLRSTRLKRLDDTLMVIPNSQLSDQPLVNWGVRHRRRLDLPISVTYDTPRDKLDAFVQQLRRTALEQPRASAEDCFVGVAAFGPSSIDIECRVFVKVYSYEAQVSARHRLICDVIELAKHMDVEFAFPTRTLHIKPPDNVEATVDDSFNSGKEPAEGT